LTKVISCQTWYINQISRNNPFLSYLYKQSFDYLWGFYYWSKYYCCLHHQNLMRGGLWRLTPLSAIFFSYIVANSFVGEENHRSDKF